MDAASFHANVSIYIYRETNPSLYNIRAFVWISRLTFAIGELEFGNKFKFYNFFESLINQITRNFNFSKK